MLSNATNVAHRIVDAVLIISLLLLFFAMANGCVGLIVDSGLGTMKGVLLSVYLLGLSVVAFLMLSTVVKNLVSGDRTIQV